jgi:hypothetical protein
MRSWKRWVAGIACVILLALMERRILILAGLELPPVPTPTSG